MRKSCVIYAEWTDQILNLPNDMAGEYSKAILQYAIYGEKVNIDNPVLKAMLVPVFKQLDKDAEAWEETKRQRSEAGKKGMASRWHNKAITNDNEVMQDITNITVNENVNVNVKKNKRSTFHDFPQRKIDYTEFKKVNDNV